MQKHEKLLQPLCTSVCELLQGREECAVLLVSFQVSAVSVSSIRYPQSEKRLGGYRSAVSCDGKHIRSRTTTSCRQF